MRHDARAAAVILQVALAIAQDGSNTPSNIMQVASSQFLGNVTSTNTGWGRDLGFQGQIGSCYINTFGDDFKCSNENPQEDCFFAPSARNSCTQPMSPTTYQDYFVDAQGAPRPCVGPQGPEQTTTPMGITNVVQLTSTKGIVYVLPGHPTAQNKSVGYQGAGYALITVDSDCNTISVDRPDRSLWNGNIADSTIPSKQSFNESLYGDHGVLAAEDGYLYVYGAPPHSPANIALARVQPESATELTGYEYWNGSGWQTDRIHNPTKSIAVMNNTAQGSAFWSPYYSRYVYLSTSFGTVTAQTAVDPWGPWNDAVTIWSLEKMPYRFYPAADSSEAFYTPAFQPKWSNANRSEIVLWVTYSIGTTNTTDHGGHQVGTAVKVKFMGGNASATGNIATSGNGVQNGANGWAGIGSSWSMVMPALIAVILAIFPV